MDFLNRQGEEDRFCQCVILRIGDFHSMFFSGGSGSQNRMRKEEEEEGYGGEKKKTFPAVKSPRCHEYSNVERMCSKGKSKGKGKEGECLIFEERTRGGMGYVRT